MIKMKQFQFDMDIESDDIIERNINHFISSNLYKLVNVSTMMYGDNQGVYTVIYDDCEDDI